MRLAVKPASLVLRRRLLMGVSVLLMAVALVVAVVDMTTEYAEPRQTGAFADFRDISYYPVVALTDGVNPYEADSMRSAYPVGDSRFPLYAPHHLTIHAPLALLSFESAVIGYTVLSLIGMFVLVRVSLRLTGMAVTPPALLGLTALVVASFPGRANLVNGEPTVLIALAMYLAFWASDEDHLWLGAIGVAISLVKPQFGVPFVLILLFSGRWRVALRGLLVTAIMGLPVLIRLLAISGPRGTFDAWQETLKGSPSVSEFTRIDLVNSLAPAASELVSIAAMLIVLSIAVLIERRLGPGSFDLGHGPAFTAILLVIHHSVYDLILLSWPAVALIAVSRRQQRVTPVYMWMFAALALIFFNPLSAEGFRGLFDTPPRFGLVFTFGLAALLAGYGWLAFRENAAFEIGDEDGGVNRQATSARG